MRQNQLIQSNLLSKLFKIRIKQAYKICIIKMMNSNISINGITYKICAIIGEGAAAVVYLAKDQQNRSFALKMIRNYNHPMTKELVDAQIKIQKQFEGNKFVIQYIGVQKMDKIVYLILELGQCSLSHWIDSSKQMWQPQFINMVCDVCQGLMSIHKKKIIHRDIKPENIIKKDGIYKITDFGVSSDKEKDQGIVGTPLYLAPEMLFQENNTLFTNKVDVWSFGVTAFQVFFKVNPFCPNKNLSEKQAMRQLKANIKQLTPNFTIQKFINFLKRKKLMNQVKIVQKKVKNSSTKLVDNLCKFFEPDPQKRDEIDLFYVLFESLQLQIKQPQIRKTQRLKRYTSWQQVPEDIRMFCKAKDLFYQLSAYFEYKMYNNALFGLEIAIWFLQGRNYGGTNYVFLDQIETIKLYREPGTKLWQKVKQYLSQYYFYLKTQEQIEMYDKLTQLRMHILLCSVWWLIIQDDKFFCNMVSNITGLQIEHPLGMLQLLQVYSDRNILLIQEKIVSRYYVTS